MIVHVGEQNPYIEKVGYQGSITNCIIFSLWEKLEHICFNLHQIMESTSLLKDSTISFLLLQHESIIRDSSVDVERILSKESQLSKQCDHQHKLLMLALTLWVLDKVVVLMLMVPIILPQEEREIMIEIMIMLEMMEGILDNKTKIITYWVHSLVKLFSHTTTKMKTVALEEPIQALELLKVVWREETTKEDNIWWWLLFY